MRKYLPVPALIAIGFLAAGGLVFWLTRPSGLPAAGGSDARSERMFWRERLKTLGAQRAYEEFKMAYRAVEFGRRHTLTHLWGEVLFEETGDAGIAACDEGFEFGCYHGFFTRAVAAGGTAVLPRLDMACRSAFGELVSGCQHGIGHGILEYAGHGNLLTALELCDAVPQKDPIAGCTAGVFMEYNLPIVIRAEDDAVMQFRPITPSDPYVPCPGLPARFRQSCYHELTQLWDKYFDYAMIGKFCTALADADERHACFMGVGNVAAPSSQYDVSETVAKCRLMPSARGIAACRMSSSWSFWASPEHRHLAAGPCNGLQDAIVSECAPPRTDPL